MATTSASFRVKSLTATVATGTAPFTVSSSTKVNNLNADLLDGLDSTYFYSPANPPPGSGNSKLTVYARDTSTVSVLTNNGSITIYARAGNIIVNLNA